MLTHLRVRFLKSQDVEDEIEAIAEKYDVSTDVLENITYYSLEQLNMYNAEYSLDLGNVEQSITLKNQGDFLYMKVTKCIICSYPEMRE